MPSEAEISTLVDLVKAKPAPVIVAIFFVILATWAVTHWIEGARVDYWKDRASVVSQLSSAEIKTILEERWPSLTDEEAMSLEERLRAIPKPNGIILRCGGSDCYALADSLKQVIKKVGWNFDEDSVAYPGLIGVGIFQPDPTDRSLADSIASATKGKIVPALNVSSTTWTFIAIGRKLRK